jgi:hypothetical protein
MQLDSSEDYIFFDSDVIDDDLSEVVSESVSIREKFAAALSSKASFLRLVEGSKKPRGRYSIGGRNRLDSVPRLGNFGVIPCDDLLIFDFDRHIEGANSIDEQIDFFSRFLNISLRESLAVVTQTGGVHVYVSLPKNSKEILKETPKSSLRMYSESFSELSGEKVVLDADLRTSLTTGYVVGPGSSLLRQNVNGPFVYKEYWIADETVGFKPRSDFSLQSLSLESLKKLAKVVEHRRNKKLSEKIKKFGFHPSAFELTEEEKRKQSQEQNNLSDSLPEESALIKLYKNMNERNFKTFHQKRAFVKSCLHCCYSEIALMKVCRAFHIDKDTYSGSVLTSENLLNDLLNFIPKESFHGPYCIPGAARIRRITLAERAKASRIPQEERLKKLKEKVASGSLSQSKKGFTRHAPKILNIEVAFSELKKTTNRKKLPQKIVDSMFILEAFVNPLLNVGCTRIVLSQDKIQKVLKISESRSSAALRLLRETRILTLFDRQKTGLAPTYRVPQEFTIESEDLELQMKNAWHIMGKKPDTFSVIDFRTEEFVNAQTGTFISKVRRFNVSKELQSFFIENPRTFSIFEISKTYLSHNRKNRQEVAQ